MILLDPSSLVNPKDQFDFTCAYPDYPGHPVLSTLV